MPTWRGGPPTIETPRLPPTMGHAPRMPRTSGALAREFRWPVGLSVTVPLGLSIGWLSLSLFAGKSFDVAFRQAGYILSVSFMFLIVVLPIGSWVIDHILEWKRARPERVVPRPKAKREPYPVPVTRRDRPRETMQDKLERALARGPLPRVGQGLREMGERLTSASPPKRLQAKYAQSVSPVQAWVEDPAVSQMEKLYHITHYFYGKKVKRDDFKPFGEGWQSLYAEYKMWVSETGFNWVDLDGQRTIVGWRLPEHECYASDRTLKRIAARNGFVFPEGDMQ